MRSNSFQLLGLLAFVLSFSNPQGHAQSNQWDKEKAAMYLDGRSQAWLEFSTADRGQGSTKTSCLCCHTVVPYMISRQVLRAMTDSSEATEFEKKLLAQTKMRIEKWETLDTPELELLYDFNENKKKESKGTEAVLNAVVLAFEDRDRVNGEPSESLQEALANLWKTQVSSGDLKGSWDWLNFGLEPWESVGARYFGASLAAIAVGTASGYYVQGADQAIDVKVDLLRGYLKGKYPNQGLYNKIWGLWAAVSLDGILSSEEREQLIEQIFAKQQPDGGWNLASLGPFVRSDGTAQTESDGYSTGLIIHVLFKAGHALDDERIQAAMNWLKQNQQPSGAWRATSVNKIREAGQVAEKFMSDAATAYAVLALSHQ